MEFTRACYSISKLNNAANMIKEFNITAKRKNEHFAKYQELEKIFEYAALHLNTWLFDPYIELKEYRNASYNFKNYTKKELDNMLKHKVTYFKNECNAIMSAIRIGEVDSIA